MIKITDVSKGREQNNIGKRLLLFRQSADLCAGWRQWDRQIHTTKCHHTTAGMDSGKVEIDGIDHREFKSKFQFFYVPDSKKCF